MKPADQRRRRASLKRVLDTTVRGIVKTSEAVVPGLSVVVEHARAILDEKRKRRVEDFLVLVLGPRASDNERKRFEDALTNEPFCLEAFKKMLEDEEGEKAWAYAAAFQAFADARVPVELRLHFLRALRDLTAGDILAVMPLARQEVDDHEVLSREGVIVTPSTAHLLAAMESQHPNLVEVLVKWGFWYRRDGDYPPGPQQGFTLLSQVLVAAPGAPQPDTHDPGPSGAA